MDLRLEMREIPETEAPTNIRRGRRKENRAKRYSISYKYLNTDMRSTYERNYKGEKGNSKENVRTHSGSTNRAKCKRDSGMKFLLWPRSSRLISDNIRMSKWNRCRQNPEREQPRKGMNGSVEGTRPSSTAYIGSKVSWVLFWLSSRRIMLSGSMSSSGCAGKFRSSRSRGSAI